MPKSKLQNFIFTVCMVTLMVFTMTVYNLAFEMDGLVYPTFLVALKEMWIEVVFCSHYRNTDCRSYCKKTCIPLQGIQR